MKNVVTVAGSSIVALLIISPFILQIQKAYSEDAFWKGYQDGKDDRNADRRYDDYCSVSRNDDLYCISYKLGYTAGWNAAGIIYSERDKYYPERHFDDDDD